MIDQDGPRLHSRECTVGAQGYCAQVGVVAHAGEHEIGASRGLRGLARGGGGRAAVAAYPVVRLARCAVIDRDVVTGAGEVPGHRVAHHPQAEEGNGGGEVIGDGGSAHVWNQAEKTSIRAARSSPSPLPWAAAPRRAGRGDVPRHRRRYCAKWRCQQDLGRWQ
ncbi:hypothetical protein GALL_528690 [mine drainage metagenome]|uniref:Uncharacterized protein n=1 Tax=mine drainage metagenome TaxID=410659 RepID=A0A1J5P3B1_9ZZZZ